MTEKQSLEFNSNIDVGEAAAYLEALARGLRDGQVLIESGDKSLSIDVSDAIEIELEAKWNPEKGKSSIELKLGWVIEAPVEEEVRPSLLITSGVTAAAGDAAAAREADGAADAEARPVRRGRRAGDSD